MEQERKLIGEERRNAILEWLKETDTPLTGSFLAKKAAVSRQVIVQDISLLKAKNEPIIATSQGYVYMASQHAPEREIEQIIACKHDPVRTEEELTLIVDFGVTVKDVMIEHPVYGELTASIRVSTRKQVADFVHHISNTGASYLSELTDGVHLHTLTSYSQKQLDQAIQALDDAGFLIKD
ncbi:MULTISPECIES: transcription repressor NadR [Bacillus]|uniref:transcription repressor NadR n=1 Tax=Bacillus TaxID=1386 RepID=UPI000B44582F|nr:transcription repressor NadR [Bacillus pumilus]MCP1149404.1 transcription repressor NadR [Bacillus sp. 1735sda2]AVI41809.1 transcription repressor NadR [Bacillus pumilus]MBQ4815373.1 transcription repressor NadR [Bacillus pumilus]MBU8638724.1 transcription repressor NadR [Bacillus pumilus]MBU8695634.1 transcription repressor NadR [Bacillus pumilus]